MKYKGQKYFLLAYWPFFTSALNEVAVKKHPPSPPEIYPSHSLGRLWVSLDYKSGTGSKTQKGRWRHSFVSNDNCKKIFQSFCSQRLEETRLDLSISVSLQKRWQALNMWINESSDTDGYIKKNMCGIYNVDQWIISLSQIAGRWKHSVKLPSSEEANTQISLFGGYYKFVVIPQLRFKAFQNTTFFPLSSPFVRPSQLWYHIFSPVHDDLVHTNHTLSYLCHLCRPFHPCHPRQRWHTRLRSQKPHSLLSVVIR